MRSPPSPFSLDGHRPFLVVMDDVLEHLNTLNELTPKVRTSHATVDPALIFGLDSKLFLDGTQSDVRADAHHDEVETATVWCGGTPPTHTHGHAHENTHVDSHEDVKKRRMGIDDATLTSALETLSKETVYRVKGFVRLDPDARLHIVNWAFGRTELVEYTGDSVDANAIAVRLTIMGERGEVGRASRKFAEKLGAQVA